MGTITAVTITVATIMVAIITVATITEAIIRDMTTMKTVIEIMMMGDIVARILKRFTALKVIEFDCF